MRRGDSTKTGTKVAHRAPVVGAVLLGHHLADPVHVDTGELQAQPIDDFVTPRCSLSPG